MINSFFIFIFFYPRPEILTMPAMAAKVTGIVAHVISIASVISCHAP
tara:strand:- start:68 stop:208 length:141 start_codon:yes stop_codon:yes gene_type:complete